MAIANGGAGGGGAEAALPPGEQRGVVVIGAGQAGLAMAACLQRRGIRPLVLERNRVGHAWQHQRWDSFCLVTPNWQCRLPGMAYDGPDPEGFMGRDAVVAHLQRYAAVLAPDLREGVAVNRLEPVERGYRVHTDCGTIVAEQVVVATGGYHQPSRPALSAALPADLVQIDARDYRNPDQLPAGPVLVVGSGQSGCQIAEDLFIAGRTVHLSVGSAPRSPRRYRGRDVVDWLDRMGYYAMPIDEHDDPRAVRAKTNHYLTGRDGGREIDLRRRALEGMVLHGRLLEISADRLRLRFADDLATRLDDADAVYRRIRASIDATIEREGIDAPLEPPYSPCWHPPADHPQELDLTSLAGVVWCTGYRSDHRWIEVPVFDGAGQPCHRRGVTASAGLYFLGLPWLHTWGSGRFCGVADDAEHLADVIRLQRQRRDAWQERRECTALLGS